MMMSSRLSMILLLLFQEGNARAFFGRKHRVISGPLHRNGRQSSMLGLGAKEREEQQHETRLALKIPRGGSAEAAAAAATEVVKDSNLVIAALQGLKASIANGPKADTLVLLATTAFNTPLCQRIGLSPILGFLVLGILLGPNGMGLVHDIHQTEMLADIGIVFFLFEMGIHLSIGKLLSMRTTVFGLGGSQFGLTAIAVAVVATLCGLSPAAAVILGGGLALSSSAFVLQLLKDKDQLETEYGKNSFGVLLLQDLMVVPLLVITPILAGTGGGVGSAILAAVIQLAMALSVIGLFGKYLITPLYDTVTNTASQEAFVGLILLTVLGMSFLTEGLGLSNTLGPFLAGVLLAENKHVHDIEREASPIRGILVGLFFFTVGFEIDLQLISSKFGLVSCLVGGLLLLKTGIAVGVAKAFGLDTSTARRLGLVLSQGGEFAFVAFRMARSYGILDEKTTKLMLTVVSLSMAFTPALEDYGASMMEKERQQLQQQQQQQQQPQELSNTDLQSSSIESAQVVVEGGPLPVEYEDNAPSPPQQDQPALPPQPDQPASPPQPDQSASPQPASVSVPQQDAALPTPTNQVQPEPDTPLTEDTNSPTAEQERVVSWTAQESAERLEDDSSGDVSALVQEDAIPLTEKNDQANENNKTLTPIAGGQSSPNVRADPNAMLE